MNAKYKTIEGFKKAIQRGTINSQHLDAVIYEMGDMAIFGKGAVFFRGDYRSFMACEDVCTLLGIHISQRFDSTQQIPAQAENRLTATRARVAAAEAALDAADAATIDNARVLYNAALHEMWQAMKAEDV